MTSRNLVSIREPTVRVYEDLPFSQNDLFVKASEWMVLSFSDPTSTIEFTDKDAGILFGKYLLGGTLTITNNYTTDTRVYAKIDIRIKNDKARISIEPLKEWHYSPISGGLSKTDAEKKMNDLCENFHLFIQKKGIDF